LLDTIAQGQLSVAVLDALDREALARACRESDIVVNCVGPYIINGYDIAETVVRNGRHYLDFAFEQFHYQRIRNLDGLARANNVALITAAGEVAGLSSVLCAHCAQVLGGIERLTVYALESGSADSESGFSSIMNGALEPALNNQDFVDGRYVTARMGSDVIVRSFREPFGEMKLISDPSIDSLIVPRRVPVRTI